MTRPAGFLIAALFLTGGFSFAGINENTLVKLWLKGVEYHSTEPRMEVFLPAPEKATGTAIVICPGGGLMGVGG